MSTRLLDVLDDAKQACRAVGALQWINRKRFKAPVPGRFVDTSGPMSFWSGDVPEMAEALKTIDTEPRSKYKLTYVPTNKKKDGTLRKIEVDVKADYAWIRRQRGNYAPYDPMDRWKHRALEHDQSRYEKKQEEAAKKVKEAEGLTVDPAPVLATDVLAIHTAPAVDPDFIAVIGEVAGIRF